jgi:prepilin-type N-terminal cleavage/methylation domain-containing protein
MIRYLQRLKAKKGLTLVEVLIATVIFSLILVAVFSLFTPINQVAETIRADSDMHRLVSLTESFFVRQLRNSSELEIHWWPDPTTINWTAAANSANTFRNKHGFANGNPQALIVREVADETRIYNVRLNEAGDTTALTELFVNAVNELDRWRLFNPSFYADINLDFQFNISPEITANQRRGNVYLQMQMDAYRGNKVPANLSLNSRSVSDTLFTWIGGVNGPANDSANPGAFQARVNPGVSQSPPHRAISGDFVILYHNDEYLNRSISDCPRDTCDNLNCSIHCQKAGHFGNDLPCPLCCTIHPDQSMPCPLCVNCTCGYWCCSLCDTNYANHPPPPAPALRLRGMCPDGTTSCATCCAHGQGPIGVPPYLGIDDRAPVASHGSALCVAPGCPAAGGDAAARCMVCANHAACCMCTNVCPHPTCNQCVFCVTDHSGCGTAACICNNLACTRTNFATLQLSSGSSATFTGLRVWIHGPPGQYHVEVRLNDNRVNNRTINFVRNNSHTPSALHNGPWGDFLNGTNPMGPPATVSLTDGNRLSFRNVWVSQAGSHHAAGSEWANHENSFNFQVAHSDVGNSGGIPVGNFTVTATRQP